MIAFYRCEKQYVTPSDLKNHKKSQHMQKDIPCGNFFILIRVELYLIFRTISEICRKLFATQKNLKRHILCHEEPKFKCTFKNCSKAFVLKSKLKIHLKLHAGNRDHLCHLCEKSYICQKDLKRHLDVQHQATTYYCEICPFTNSRKDYLRNHLNSAHKHLTVEQKNEILARTRVTHNAV